MDLSKASVIYVGDRYRILCDPETHQHYNDVPGYALRRSGNCKSWIELADKKPHCTCKANPT